MGEWDGAYDAAAALVQAILAQAWQLLRAWCGGCRASRKAAYSEKERSPFVSSFGDKLKDKTPEGILNVLEHGFTRETKAILDALIYYGGLETGTLSQLASRLDFMFYQGKN